MDEDIAPIAAPVHTVGMALDRFSVDELHERIALLKAEIKRVELELEKKDESRSAAENAFKL